MRFFAKLFSKYAPQPEEKPYKIKLPKGSLPTYIHLNPYQKISWKLMRKFAEKSIKKKKYAKLEMDLMKAHILLRPQEYLAYVYFTTFLMIIAGVIVGMVLSFMGLAFPDAVIRIVFLIIGISFAVFLPVITYFILLSSPASKAKKRGKDIDTRLPAAVNFIAALSSADVTVPTIFKELSMRDEYGEIAKEAEWITRDTELLGKDILSAIEEASRRSPSVKWQEFLQGVVTTATSGGRLKPFFLSKSEEYERERRLNLKKNMESLGLFAEIYVTVGVAFPLFLVVIIAIMALINKSGSAGIVMLLEVVVAVMIPMLIFIFSYFIYSTSKEVSD